MIGKVLSTHWFSVTLLLITAYATLYLIFQPGMFTGHDIWHQVARLYHFSNSLENGLVMPGWVSTLAFNHGYPLFFFSYQLPWIVAMPLIWSGFSIFAALKVLFFIGFSLAGVSMYFSSYWIIKNKLAAFLSSLIYLVSPAHFASVFVSASIGTVFQFVLFPLILGILWLLFVNKNYKAGILLGLVVAASVLTHLMSFVFFVPIIGLFAISLFLHSWYKNRALPLRKLYYLLISFVVAVGASAYYFLPMFELLSKVNAGNGVAGFSEIYKGHFITFKQIVYSPWGFGPIVYNAKDGEISFQLGIAQWLGLAGVALVLMAAGVRNWQKSLINRFFILETNVFVLGSLLALFVLTIFIMLEPSKPMWDLVSQYFTLDYPHRYLMIAVLLSSLATGLAVSCLKSRWFQRLIVVVLCSVALYTNRNHMKPNLFTDFDLETYIRSEVTTNTFHEYLPVSANSALLKQETDILAYDILTQAALIDVDARGIRLNVWTPKAVSFSIHQFDFAGQQAYVNGMKVPHTSGGGGLMHVSVPAGHSIIETKYEYPPKYYLYLSISLVTLLASYYLLIKEPKGSS